MGRGQEKKETAYELLQFSIPLFCGGLLQKLYSWVDAYIVGHAEGELALAAIGASGTVIDLYISLMAGLTMGLSILAAQEYGRGKTVEIGRMLSSFSVFFGLIFLGLAALGTGVAGPLLELLHTPRELFGMSQVYLKGILAGVPFLALYNIYTATLRAIGDSRAPFWAVLISSGVNAALDVLLVAVLGLGVGGAAAATVVSQGAMTGFIAVYTVKKYPFLRFYPHKKRGGLAALKEGIRLSMPLTAQSGMVALGDLILQHFLNGFGAQTVAAFTTAYCLDSVLLLPIENLGFAISTKTAQSKGAEEKERIRHFLAAGTGMLAAVSLFLTAMLFFFGGSLMGIFGISGRTAALGGSFFKRIAGFYIFYGASVALRGALEGVGDVLYSSAAGVLTLAVRIGLSYVMRPAFGNMTVAYAEAFSWVFLLLLYLLRFWCKREELGIKNRGKRGATGKGAPK